MKVILLQDIARVGRKNEVKDVPDGHAQNFLIPRRLAEPANAGNLKKLQEMEGKRAATAEGELAAFQKAVEKLQEVIASIPAWIAQQS